MQESTELNMDFEFVDPLDETIISDSIEDVPAARTKTEKNPLLIEVDVGFLGESNSFNSFVTNYYIQENGANATKIPIKLEKVVKTEPIENHQSNEIFTKAESLSPDFDTIVDDDFYRYSSDSDDERFDIKDEDEMNLSKGENVNEDAIMQIGTQTNPKPQLIETGKTGTKKSLNNHIISDDGSFGCCYCSKTFKTKKWLYQHELKAHPDLGEKFNCTECDAFFKSSASLISHQRVKHPKKDCWYSCSVCPVKYNQKWRLDSHMKVHNDDRPFVCSICSSRFKRKVELHGHEKRHRRTFQCLDCKEMFDTKFKLRRHNLSKHLMEKQFQYECSLCTLAFSTQTNLRLHMTVHDDSKPFKCNYCSMAFKRKEGLRCHERLHRIKGQVVKTENGDQLDDEPNIENDPTNIGFSCTNCPEKFGTKFMLHQHMKSKHNIFGLFGCSNCSMSFETFKELKDHEWSHLYTWDDTKKLYECRQCSEMLEKRQLYLHKLKHNPGFMCSHCSRQFTTRGEMERHELRHTDERPFVCEECGKRFRSDDDLKIHSKRHSYAKLEKTFSCNECEKKFHTSALLRHHQKSHAAEQPHKCKYCDKQFRDSDYARDHERAHSGDRPYVCEYCQKTFAYRVIYVAHLKIHTTEKKFSCEQCSKRFRRRTNLEVHMRTHLGLKTYIYTGEKKFQCEQCPRKFERGGDFNRHVKTHMRLKTPAGEKKFQCEQCPRKFVRRGDFNRHLKIHEKNSENRINCH